jgi:hypothetical protein
VDCIADGYAYTVEAYGFAECVAVGYHEPFGAGPYVDLDTAAVAGEDVCVGCGGGTAEELTREEVCVVR